MRLFDRISFLFFLALIPSLIAPALFPSLRLTFFAPFLVVAFYRKPFISCLWLAVLCGTLMDLLSSQARFGLYAVNYCVTTWLIYNQKRHFFEDSLSTLPIMTYIFVVLSTLIQVLLLDIFEKKVILTMAWVGTDIIVWPMLDAFYAFLLFTLPRSAIPSFKRA